MKLQCELPEKISIYGKVREPRDDLDDAVSEGDVVGPAVEGDAEGDDADDAEDEPRDGDGEAALLEAEAAAAGLHPDAPAPPEQRLTHPRRLSRPHAHSPRVMPQPSLLLILKRQRANIAYSEVHNSVRLVA